MSAGIELVDTILSLNIGLTESNEIITDLNYQEEREVISSITLAF